MKGPGLELLLVEGETLWACHGFREVTASKAKVVVISQGCALWPTGRALIHSPTTSQARGSRGVGSSLIVQRVGNVLEVPSCQAGALGSEPGPLSHVLQCLPALSLWMGIGLLFKRSGSSSSSDSGNGTKRLLASRRRDCSTKSCRIHHPGLFPLIDKAHSSPTGTASRQ